jgi:NAD+ synthetase
MSVGYATLYGDMAGGFAPIKDCSKLLVWRLARWRNAQGTVPVIPQRIIDRPPTAELRDNQLDSDSLPPYEVLDPILEAFIEDDRSVDEIVAVGFERATAETYKKFFFPSTPPGKFAGKPVTHPQMLRRRKWLIAPYAAIWAAVILAGALGVTTTSLP